MSEPTIADALREIDTLASAGLQVFDSPCGDFRPVAGGLRHIQWLAQTALQDVEAFDWRLQVLVAALSNLTRFCREEFRQIYTCGLVTTERKDQAALLLSDAESTLAREKEANTGEPT